jgi:hypothetical protein
MNQTEINKYAEQVANQVVGEFIRATMQTWVDATPGLREAGQDRDEWVTFRRRAADMVQDRLDRFM